MMGVVGALVGFRSQRLNAQPKAGTVPDVAKAVQKQKQVRSNSG